MASNAICLGPTPSIPEKHNPPIPETGLPLRSPLNLALIGCGRWGRIIVRTIPRITGARLSHVVSNNPETATIVPAGCTVSGDWSHVIAADDVDAVLIATPPDTHAAIMLAAIDQGKPFFVEKPMAMNAAEALDVQSRAEAAGVFGMVDHIHLFSPAFRQLCAMSVRLGPITSIEAMAGKNAPDVTTPVIWDWGPHDVAMCLHLLGRQPSEVSAMTDNVPTPGSGSLVKLRLDFAAPEISANLAFSNNLDAHLRRFRVAHRDGTLTYEDAGNPALLFSPNEANAAARKIECDRTLPLDIALTDFCTAVRQGSQDNRSLSIGVETIKILEAASRALETGISH